MGIEQLTEEQFAALSPKEKLHLYFIAAEMLVLKCGNKMRSLAGYMRRLETSLPKPYQGKPPYDKTK